MTTVNWADEPSQVINFQYKFKRGTAERWLEVDPVLAAGEPGYESDTGKFKMGNGISKWSGLPYFTPRGAGVPDDGSAASLIEEHVNDLEPHPVYDAGPSLLLLYENAKV